MSGRTVSHYELLEEVAQGGMGVVYKARDRRLDRLVALKFLSQDLRTAPAEVERFLHEARAISRLNHPNIATIYDVGKEGEAHFLALEFLPGGTLKTRVENAYSSGQPLEAEEIIFHAIQIAKALAHAHRHGIIHRDIKSDNILLDGEGTVKLTDFGVALMAGRGSSTDIDETAGTVAYMSPEQAQGLEIDHRSDIFSYGIVLFELATGKVPFWDTEEAVILYDIVNTSAPPLSNYRKDLPDGLQAVVSKVLAKNRAERYQSMDEVLADLKALARRLQLRDTKPSLVTSLEPTIAVLPFVDMSPEKDQEYFCDGITEEIINALTGVKGLKVVSRTSTFRFKGKPYDIRVIGEQLSVQTVLEGSVRKAGNRLRVTVQQINVADGYHFWSERYDRELADVFAVQDEIAQAVVANLRTKLAVGPAASVVRRQTENVDAYNCYLQGRYHVNQRTHEALAKSLECFQSAVQQDPTYALAFAGRAEAYTLLASTGYVKDQAETLGKARDAARRALQLDERCAEAHVALALVYFRADWDWERCEQEFRRAIELNDGYATAHHHYAMFLAAMSRIDEALIEIRRAHELDPLSLIISTGVGRILSFARRFDEAITQCKRTIALNPQFANAYFDLGLACAQVGRFEEAIEATRKLQELTGEPIRPAIMLCTFYAHKGEREKALEYYRLIHEAPEREHLSAVASGIVEASLGNLDRAMELLYEGYEKRDTMLVYLQSEPFLDNIRSHQDYPELLRKMRFPTRSPS